jgi:hypothetical protein
MMKRRLIMIGLTVLSGLLATAWAADVAGKWVAEIPGRQGMSEVTFDFQVNGTELTGTMTNPMGNNEITEGKINGDDISFIVPISFGGNEMKILYKGKVAGDEIKFTQEMQGGSGGPGRGMGGPPPGGEGGPGGGRPGGGERPGREFVAKRVK